MGRSLLGFQLSKRLQADAIAIYRKRHGLLSADEIRVVRERFGLAQANLARLLRLGANTVSGGSQAETFRPPRWTSCSGSSGIYPAASTTCAATRPERARAIEVLARDLAEAPVCIGFGWEVVSALHV